MVKSDAQRGRSMLPGKRRFSVTLDEQTHRRLLELANKNDVSISWMVRYAISHLLQERQYGRQEQLGLHFEEFR